MRLGELTGSSWQHLGAVERGEVAPSEPVVAECDRVLAAGGQLLGLFPTVVTEQAAARHSAIVARRHDVRPEATEDPWARLREGALRPSTVSATTIQELEDITDRQRKLYGVLPSAQMAVVVEAHLGVIMSLLTAPQPNGRKERLVALAGEAAGFSAWLWFDLGDHHKMSNLYGLASELLSTTVDPGLRSYVSGYRALTHEANGLGVQAIGYASEALAQASASTSLLTRSWLCAVSASAKALEPDHQAEVPALLDRAQCHLDAARGKEPWMYDFDQTSLAGFMGQSYLRLGDAARAASAFTDGLATIGAGRERKGAQLTMGLAESRLLAGEPEECLDAATRALEVFARVGFSSGLRRVGRLRNRLEGAGHASMVAKLDEQARALTRGAA
ncbi:hypothetical protein Acor_54800 [Acrocarpospora corrugata]|uniref:Transcriptional regulator n=2 Tax=Acrocarpospora corrugata TaxID=35763 RepID=A0A5M3W3R3_9ACTN|nr:hypothetical protein Acor_54800 [Acrocarpospora corrugata]